VVVYVKHGLIAACHRSRKPGVTHITQPIAVHLHGAQLLGVTTACVCWRGSCSTVTLALVTLAGSS
jgi:hypothetical protein